MGNRGFFKHKNSKAITIIIEKLFQIGFTNIGSVVHKQNKEGSHLKMLKDKKLIILFLLGCPNGPEIE